MTPSECQTTRVIRSSLAVRLGYSVPYIFSFALEWSISRKVEVRIGNREGFSDRAPWARPAGHHPSQKATPPRLHSVSGSCSVRTAFSEFRSITEVEVQKSYLSPTISSLIFQSLSASYESRAHGLTMSKLAICAFLRNLPLSSAITSSQPPLHVMDANSTAKNLLSRPSANAATTCVDVPSSSVLNGFSSQYSLNP